MNPTENQQEPLTTHPSQKKPFILRIIGIASIVMGFIGSLFFASVFLFQITDADFALRFQYTYYNMAAFIAYLGFGLLLHLSLLVSGIYIIRVKRGSHWLFLGSATGLLLLTLMTEHNLLWPEVIITFILFFILFSYRKKLN